LGGKTARYLDVGFGARMQRLNKLVTTGLRAVRSEYFFVAAALLFTVCAGANVIGYVLR
jgi:hypothetical protein